MHDCSEACVIIGVENMQCDLKFYVPFRLISRYLLLGRLLWHNTAVAHPPDVIKYHRFISANTPQPRY